MNRFGISAVLWACVAAHAFAGVVPTLGQQKPGTGPTPVLLIATLSTLPVISNTQLGVIP